MSVFNPIGSIKTFLSQLDATDAQQLRRVTLAYIALHAVFWFFIAMVSHTAPHKDSIEELFWLQHFDWGYPKFGPIGTWWVHLFVVVFGRAVWVTYLAGVVNVALMLIVVWRIALLIATPARALMAVVLTSLVIYHNVNGLQVSSNLMQLFPTALFLWAVLLAVRNQNWWRWALLGIAGAICLLTKYAVGIWFAVMGIWILLDSRMHNRRAMMGISIAMIAGALAMIPHIEWLIREDAPTLRYMQRQVGGQVNHLAEVFKFLGSQLGKLAPLLIALVVIQLQFKRDGAPAQSWKGSANTTTEERYVSFTAYGPMLVTCVLGAIWIDLNANWATAYFVVLGLWALRYVPRVDTSLALRRVVGVGLFLNILIAVSVGLYYGLVVDLTGRVARANYPAKQQGALLDEVWDAKTRGPLKVVIGETWVAGVTSVMSKDQPLVVPYGLYHQGPAVSPALIKKCGALIVIDAAEESRPLNDGMKSFLAQATKTGSINMYWNRFRDKNPIEIKWAIIEPESKGACR
ncbi:glycosyltransferase family 39 protein [Alcaligenaceae bacterium LF4-65]|uniref:Glycosyltransferase family 39 protein n=1 Tax=Zwartia hollandica TaxID=324606 RepID=A0A953NB80_9BURK|nr:glycosyltransferase family 39 protein [Zwartia hollandica]MBZ1350489.1 glycosyltransferase family 39 protein [Zwartia hollandica]